MDAPPPDNFDPYQAESQMTDISRDIGALEARADAQEARLERIEKKVDVLVEAIAQSKGGIRGLQTALLNYAKAAGVVPPGSDTPDF